MDRKVLLLNFSGIGKEIFKYIEDREFPNFEKVAKRGAVAKTENVLNPADIVSRISSLTGLNPGKVGIFDAMVPTKDYRPKLAKISDEINQKTLSELLMAEGVKAIVIEETTNETKEKRKFEEGDVEEEKFLKELYSLNEKILNRSIEAMKTDWDYLEVHFDIIHKIQHVFYRCADENRPAYESKDAKKYRGLIVEAYKKADEYLGALMKELEGVGESSIFVFSDKGISPVYKYVNINDLLAKKGVIVLKEDGRTFDDVDWDNTLAYHIGFGQIRVNLKDREPHGIVEQGKEYEDVRKALIKLIGDMKDPENNEPVIEKVFKKEELYSGLYLENAPDLLLVFKKGYGTAYNDAVGRFGGRIISENKGCWRADHVGVMPTGIPGVLIAAGEGIKQGDFRAMSVMDLTPTILYYLGSSIPDNVDGKVFEQMFDEDFLKKNKIRFREVKEEIKSEDVREEERVLSEEDEEKIKERLRGLGYMA